MLTDRHLVILEQLGIDIVELQQLNYFQKEKLIDQVYAEYVNQVNQQQVAIANTYPLIQSSNSTAIIEHEASTSSVNQESLSYLQSRGLTEDQSITLIISGYCQDILKNLPFEFAVEARNLLQMKIEGF
jgi:Fe-S cluster assembly scaffold protein SufB